MTADRSTPLSDIADEANALLSSTLLHPGDVRWLTGRLVHVLISPVDASSDDIAVSLTLATTDGGTGCLAGLAVDITAAGGGTSRTTLDDDGHALLLLTTDSYRLAVEAPVEATPAVTPPIEMSDPLPLPLPLPARPAVGLRRRPRHRPVTRRPTISPATALWALPAAAVLLIATALVMVPKSPAAAAVAVVDGRTCTEAARERAADGRGHVEVVATWGNDEQDRFKEVLKGFHKDTGIRVTLANDNGSEADRNLRQTLTSRREGGCRPGVALLPQTGLLKELADGNQLWPIEDVAGRQVNDNYSQAWRDLGSVRHPDHVADTLYGVWFKASDKSLIWYNAAAFKTAGIVGTPADWEGLKAAAGKLKAAGFTPFSVAGADADAWTLTDWFENVYLRTAGRTKYEQLAAGEITWTDQSVVIALGKLAEIFGEPEWFAGGPDESLRTSFPDSVKKVFANPKNPEAAMVFEGDFVATEVAKTASRLGVDARSFPFPLIDSPVAPTLVGGDETGEATGGDVAVLLRNGGDPKDPEAEALLRYLATPKAAEPWIRAGGFLSPNKNAGGYPNPASQTAADNLAKADSLSFDLSDRLPPDFGGTPGAGMWQVLQEFLRHPEDVDGTVARLQAAYVAATK